MATLGERLQQADWTKEKHVPVIDCADSVAAGQLLEVKLTVGKEIAHPNTTEHHITWIALYFQAEDEKNPHHVGRYEFAAHGESTLGANQGPVYTQATASTWLKLSKPGTLYAVAMCNIHGLWESTKTVKIG
jgi:superoxide reductase